MVLNYSRYLYMLYISALCASSLLQPSDHHSPASYPAPFSSGACFSHPSWFLPLPPSALSLLPVCLPLEVSTISLATTGWSVLSSQVQGDGRFGRLASAHSIFTQRYCYPWTPNYIEPGESNSINFKWKINLTICSRYLLQTHHVKLTFGYKFADGSDCSGEGTNKSHHLSLISFSPP